MQGLQLRPSELISLHSAKQAGAILGVYGGEEFSETVVDQSGKTYSYVGLAPRTWSGNIDGAALGHGEFLYRSGLVYRLQFNRVSWFKILFSRSFCTAPWSALVASLQQVRRVRKQHSNEDHSTN
jgi:hypothetical protein